MKYNEHIEEESCDNEHSDVNLQMEKKINRVVSGHAMCFISAYVSPAQACTILVKG